MRTDIGSAIRRVTVTQANWYFRVIFDLSYFVIITTVLMNVIQGITIDTFGFLRDTSQYRSVYMQKTTFISSLDRGEINKEARKRGVSGTMSGFEYIQKERQHVWNYMNFIFYLKSKDEKEYMGPETRMNKCIE